MSYIAEAALCANSASKCWSVTIHSSDTINETATNRIIPLHVRCLDVIHSFFIMSSQLNLSLF